MAVYDTFVKSDFSMHLQTDMKVPLCIQIQQKHFQLTTLYKSNFHRLSKKHYHKINLVKYKQLKLLKFC